MADKPEQPRETAEEAPPDEASAPAAGGAAAQPKPVPSPVVADLVKPQKMGLFRRLNPLHLFRRESPEMYFREGENLVEHQNLALATMAYQKAISLDDSRHEGYKGLGHVFLKKGGRTNVELALKNFQEASKRNPFDDGVFAISAKVYERLGKMKEATLERKKMMIVRTLHSDSRNPVANNNMGILLLQQGQTTQALTHFQKSIESNPNYDLALRNMATTYYKMATAQPDSEKKDELLHKAKTYVAKSLQITPSASSLVIQGKILLLESRFEEVLHLCEQAEQLDPAHKGVFGLKRVALEKLNRTQEAQQAFESLQAISE